MGRLGLWLSGGAIVALVAVPIVGLVFAYLQPPGLVEPPPLDWSAVGWMTVRTLGLAAAVSCLSLLLGTTLAFLDRRMQYPGRVFLGVLCIVPVAIPSYLLAAIIRESFAPLGPLGELLGLQGTFSGMGPAIFVLTLSCTPYVHFLVSAALADFPAAEDEAARSLGAGFWRRFKVLLIPRLRPTWAFSLILIALYVVSDFGAVAVLNCEVLTWKLYEARGAQDAYLLGFAMMLCVLPLLAVVRWMSGNKEPSRGQAKSREVARIPLKGWWVVGAVVSHGFLIGFGVLLPGVVLFQWVLMGLESSSQLMPVSEPLMWTSLYTTVGTIVTVSVALVPAWIVTRRASRRVGSWMENTTYLTSALPGVLLAFALLRLKLGLNRHAPVEVAGTSLWDGLETAGVLLIVGYLMRFLAEAYAMIKPALLNMDLRQEESARSLGAGRLKVLTTITLPMIRPGLMAAFLLLFVSIAKELPVTLMLTPTGVQTLAYRVFNAQEEASFPDVGVSGLILVGLALGMQAMLSKRRRNA